jgi:hypothetical protein
LSRAASTSPRPCAKAIRLKWCTPSVAARPLQSIRRVVSLSIQICKNLNLKEDFR